MGGKHEIRLFSVKVALTRVRARVSAYVVGAKTITKHNSGELGLVLGSGALSPYSGRQHRGIVLRPFPLLLAALQGRNRPRETRCLSAVRDTIIAAHTHPLRKLYGCFITSHPAKTVVALKSIGPRISAAYSTCTPYQIR